MAGEYCINALVICNPDPQTPADGEDFTEQ